MQEKSVDMISDRIGTLEPDTIREEGKRYSTGTDKPQDTSIRFCGLRAFGD